MRPSPKVFGLVDINNAYASIERLFDPALINWPVCVLSNNDSCVVARSPEVKALGIKMGQPWFELKDLAKKQPQWGGLSLAQAIRRYVAA